MEDKVLYKQVFEKLELKKESMDPSDFKFYNIAHFPLLAKFTEEHSKNCTTCRENINLLNEIVDSLPEVLSENATTRKKFEQQKTIIESHLKKVHHMRFPGFYSSLGSLIGVFIGFLISFILNYAVGGPLFNDIMLIGLAVGLVGGITIGRMKDKNIFVRNLQL